MSRVAIGVISKPHGVRGELRVHLHNSDSTALEVVHGVFVCGVEFEIRSARIVRGGALLRLVGVDTRNQAEEMVGASVEVHRDQLELEEDDVLLDELIGCEVHLADGTPWGVVSEVISGVQDRLVIHQDGIERHLPLVDAFLLDIDLENNIVKVDPPEQLPEWEL